MSRRDLWDLLAEVAVLRDRAERACEETEALRKAYRLAIDQSWRMVRSGETRRRQRRAAERRSCDLS